MDRYEIERRLGQGQELGMRKSTDDARYLGWILVRKRIPPPASPFDPQAEAEFYQRWQAEMQEYRKQPFHLSVIEIPIEVHENGRWLENEDYRLRENLYRSSLDEVEELLMRMGYTLEQLRPRVEIDAP